MSDKKPKNIAASVKQRLLNKSKTDNRPYQELLQYYIMERFLYRLSISQHKRHFILKGALMMVTWKSPDFRPTRDIDFLGRMGNDPNSIRRVIESICQINVENDGVIFDIGEKNPVSITEDGDYTGVRVFLIAHLEKTKTPFHLDIGFGDVITPSPQSIDYPAILEDLPRPNLQGYTRESVIAEKFQAMIKLDILNSRMKDFYDIWYILRQFEFMGSCLQEAMKETFANRKTDLPADPYVFSTEFKTNQDKQKQWVAFISRGDFKETPQNFSEIVKSIEVFLMPIIKSITEGEIFSQTWQPQNGWR